MRLDDLGARIVTTSCPLLRDNRVATNVDEMTSSQITTLHRAVLKAARISGSDLQWLTPALTRRWPCRTERPGGTRRPANGRSGFLRVLALPTAVAVFSTYMADPRLSAPIRQGIGRTVWVVSLRQVVDRVVRRGAVLTPAPPGAGLSACDGPGE